VRRTHQKVNPLLASANDAAGSLIFSPKPASLEGLGEWARRGRGTLIHFGDASGPNYGRPLLALGKPNSPIAIGINASEFLAIIVIHGDLPVPMLATLVAMEATVSIRSWSRFSGCCGHWDPVRNRRITRRLSKQSAGYVDPAEAFVGTDDRRCSKHSRQ
jgi:hypothetical protein